MSRERVKVHLVSTEPGPGRKVKAYCGRRVTKWNSATPRNRRLVTCKQCKYREHQLRQGLKI